MVYNFFFVGTGTWQTPLVISSACQTEESKFQWYKF